MQKLTIDPVTRIRGPLRIEADLQGGVVREARCTGGMFRGLEIMLRGREPLDAQRLTQRICGMCSTAHSLAAALALDQAFGLAASLPRNGRVMRNLIAGSHLLQSHLAHFYQLAVLDYVDFALVDGYRGRDARLRHLAELMSGGEVAHFTPRYEGDYRLPRPQSLEIASHHVEALGVRREAQEMLAIFGGPTPHDTSVFPGGALETVTPDKIAAFRGRLERVRRFIDESYLEDVWAIARAYPDYFTLGRGPESYLSFGMLDLDSEPNLTRRRRALLAGVLDGKVLTLGALDPSQIAEEVGRSWYRSGSKLHPSHGETVADPSRSDGYSFVKAPRYAGRACEVGPLARILIADAAGHDRVRRLVAGTLSTLRRDMSALRSVLGRHIARALESKLIADSMAEWALELRPGEPTRVRPRRQPRGASGMGITEAPQGALGHWLRIEDGLIASYQVVGPTAWNCSPRDDRGEPGACERALEGTKVRDPRNPFELVRIVRSFDPCLACAVH